MNHPLPTLKPGPDQSLPISETFTSIQGEGRLTGTPSHFIRLSGCNLRCTWCDTPYASWAPEGGPRAITDLVREASDSGTEHVVVTGGEPLMFTGVTMLCDALHEAGLHITIETAGTIYPQNWAFEHADLMSISPKLANSTPKIGDARDPDGRWRRRHEQRRLNLEALRFLIDQHAERQLKFVVTSAEDLAEIETLLADLGQTSLTPADVMLMPEGVEPPSPERVAWVTRACDSRGWTYCNRLHIELFGDTRGT